MNIYIRNQLDDLHDFINQQMTIKKMGSNKILKTLDI